MRKSNMISIIVPVYNRERFLSRCIDSLINQTYGNIEIILVDDGSTDSSMSIMQKYKNSDNRIKIFSQSNSGVSSARNLGLINASGEFIQFVDSDDYIELNMCETLINALETTQADICICGYNKINLKNTCSIFGIDKVINNFREINEDFSYLYTKGFFNYPWNKMYRKNKIFNIFDITITVGEDLIFNLDNFRYMESVCFIPDCLYNYMNEASNSLTKNYKNDLVEREVYLYERINEFCKYNKISDEYRVLTINTLINVITNSIYSSSLNFRQKQKAVLKVTSNSEIKNIINQYCAYSITQKITKFCIKNNLHLFITIFLHLKLFLVKYIKYFLSLLK